MKKYELTTETKVVCGKTLHRNAWVSDNAWMHGNAQVSSSA